MVRYGCRIGYASRQINPGNWVYIHNVRTALGDVLEYQYEPQIKGLLKLSPSSFVGCKRGSGGCGVRNELRILPTVDCVSSVAGAMEREAKCRFMLGDVEDTVAFAHPYGCSQTEEDQENTRRTLANIIHHPSADGVLVLGLGCENYNVSVLMDYIDEYDPKWVRFLQCRDCEGEIEAVMELLGQLYEKASEGARMEYDASQLIIGMECDGSNELSGIMVNPAVGAFSDILISKGGTTVLTEVLEMFGAETILMNRCRDEETSAKTVKLTNDFEEYFTSHNQTIYKSPPPSNKRGGISTLEDRSLSYTRKSGSSLVYGVLEYGGRVREKGPSLLSALGNNLVTTTALTISGTQIVLFTTGRDTPFATLIPTIKIPSNSKLAGYKAGWIDFNTGKMVRAKMKDRVAIELFQYVLRVTPREKVKSEEVSFHNLVIFKQGVTLQTDGLDSGI